MKTDCKQCKGWNNSCSPDWYPNYVDDPESCEFFQQEGSQAPSADAQKEEV